MTFRYKQTRKAYSLVTGKLEVKPRHGRHECGCGDTIKVDLTEVGYGSD
jgi:hypothetical protein